MTDPCLVCPLPTCNQRDERCGWRQSPEYRRMIANWKRERERRRARRMEQPANDDRQHEREERMRKQAEYRKAHGYQMQLRYQALMLWQRGMDTLQIAREMQIEEHVVYNELLPWIVSRRGRPRKAAT